MKKQSILGSILLAICLFPIVSASECGITNLASCIPEKIFDFLLYVLNLPLQPILDLIYNLLTQPVNIDIFSSIWAIIIYMLSLFYGLLLLFVGFKLLISGYSPEKREKAKSELANILVMIVLVQASFFIYSLAIDLFSSITTAIFNLVKPDFFLLTIDNLANVGLQFSFTMPYLVSLLLAIIILVLRYMLVSAGVIFFPIGVFFYFIAPLNQYGRLILNGLFIAIALPLFYSIIFLVSAELLNLVLFQNTKILVMIGAFTFVNVGTLLFLAFVILKAALKIIAPVTKMIGLVGKFL